MTALLARVFYANSSKIHLLLQIYKKAKRSEKKTVQTVFAQFGLNIQDEHYICVCMKWHKIAYNIHISPIYLKSSAYNSCCVKTA
jgi:hypothetical protein